MSVCGQPCAFISARFVFRKRCREISILSPGVNSIAEVTYDAADCKEIYVKKITEDVTKYSFIPVIFHRIFILAGIEKYILKCYRKKIKTKGKR